MREREACTESTEKGKHLEPSFLRGQVLRPVQKTKGEQSPNTFRGRPARAAAEAAGCPEPRRARWHAGASSAGAAQAHPAAPPPRAP